MFRAVIIFVRESTAAKVLLVLAGVSVVALFAGFSRSESPILAVNLNQAQTEEILGPSAEKAESFLRSTDLSKIDPPAVAAAAVLTQELGAPTALFERQPDIRWPIASITKLMTAVIALEQFSPSLVVNFSPTAVGTDGASGAFKVGEQFSVWDMVVAMLTVSSNDSAVALAEAFPSAQHTPVADFLDVMQRKAGELGMTQTTFADPTGLSFLNQSTPRDLEKLAEYIADKHGEIFVATRQKSATILELTSRKTRQLANINSFAGTEGFLGGKTGFIDVSNGNLLSIFSVRGREIFVLVFGTQDRFLETEKVYAWLKEAIHD